jgi:hypothetical protein
MRERSDWRELHSNIGRAETRRSRGIGSRLRRLSVGGESSTADMSPSRHLLSRGTDGSNPSPSSGESRANLISGAPLSHQLAFAVDIGFDKLYAAGVLGTGSFLAATNMVTTTIPVGGNPIAFGIFIRERRMPKCLGRRG